MAAAPTQAPIAALSAEAAQPTKRLELVLEPDGTGATKAAPPFLLYGLADASELHAAGGLLAKGIRIREPGHTEIQLEASYSAEEGCSVYVWVDAHQALREGIRFFEEAGAAANASGRVLSPGDTTGCISSKCFATVIELRDGLGGAFASKQGFVRLIECSFPGCSRVVAKRLHGAAHSESAVLEIDSYDERGQPNEPALLVVDSGFTIREEAARCHEVAEMAGPDMIKIIRGPLYASQRGDDVRAGEQITGTCVGAMVIEASGAHWAVPHALGTAEASTRLQNLRMQLSAELTPATAKAAAQDGVDANAGAASVLRDLWGAGGALSSLALRKHGRAAEVATGDGRQAFLKRQARWVAHAVKLAFLPSEELSYRLKNQALLEETEPYEPPAALQAAVDEVDAQGGTNKAWGKLKGRLKVLSLWKKAGPSTEATHETAAAATAAIPASGRTAKADRFLHSFVLETDSSVRRRTQSQCLFPFVITLFPLPFNYHGCQCTCPRVQIAHTTCVCCLFW